MNSATKKRRRPVKNIFKNTLLRSATTVAIATTVASFFTVDIWPNATIGALFVAFGWLALFAYGNKPQK